jgi:chromosome segregation protein
LGEALQYLLVEHNLPEADAIDYLQQAGTGRCGFIPVGDIRCLDDRLEKRPDPEHRLLNHLRVKEGFEPVAHASWDTLSWLIRWVRPRNCSTATVGFKPLLPTDGNLLTHQGVMIGGSPDKLSGILAKKQEIKTLTAACERLAAEKIKAEEAQKKMEENIAGLKKQLQETIAEKNDADQDVMEAEKALYRADEDLKNARRHLEIVQLEQEQLMGEESDLDEEMEKMTHCSQPYPAMLSDAQEHVALASAQNRRNVHESGVLQPANRGPQASTDLRQCKF